MICRSLMHSISDRREATGEASVSELNNALLQAILDEVRPLVHQG